MKQPTDEIRHLSVRGLNVRYGLKHVVRDISFDVAPGAIFGLLGPSGAGKSSVLAALNGVVHSQGVIQFNDSDVTRLPARHRSFGHVYQEFRLFDWMSVGENVAFPCEAMGWTKSDTASAVSSTLQRVGLRLSPDERVRNLSGGERQRVALARALVFNPRALLLDEPFSHLDPPLREELKRDLLTMLQGTAIPVVLVTHDHREAFELCDRIGIMIDGALVQHGAPSDLMSSPNSHGVASLLGFSNSVMGRVENLVDDRLELRVDGAPSLWRGRLMKTPRVGDRVQAVCRPDRVSINKGYDKSINATSARVVSLHESINSLITIVELPDGRRWTVNVPVDSNIVVGSVVTCSVRADDLMVYADAGA